MNGALLCRNALSTADTAAMYALLSAHFEGVTPAQFDRDLQNKNWVILIRDDHHNLVGFSTLAAYTSTGLGDPVNVICSGDTIVDPRAWRSTALAQTWIRSVHQLRASLPPLPLYWLLITSGFRTYRLLPVFWRRFTPTAEHSRDSGDAALLQTLARERFGASFDPASGIVRFTNPQRLRPHLAATRDERLLDPHIAYFLQRNPHHARGDELACLASLDDANLTPAGHRMAYGSQPRRPVP